MARRHAAAVVAFMIAAVTATASAALAAPTREPPAEVQGNDVTPPRLSYASGEVSYWRPGAEDWSAAHLNTPLAAGDAIYAGPRSTVEVEIGANAFARASEQTELGVENLEPDFVQLEVKSGQASLDLRSLPAGRTIELDTPNSAFTIESPGYYRVDLDKDTTKFITRRGGHATLTPAAGAAVSIAPSEQVVVEGSDSPNVETYVAPEIDKWDRWNYARTDQLIDSMSARYVPNDVYGASDLDHYGAWRVVPTYGPVWVPTGVAAGWAPYSTGSWTWDPSYGWTWVDEAPWGWAPYHYGRWVSLDGVWAWAPGPLVVHAAYAPALVAFFGGPEFGVQFHLGGPAIGWVALGWGEPCLPWWGHARGRPWWGGWGGPHVVNNVVVHDENVHITNVNVFQNAHVRNAVIAVRQDRFGRGRLEPVRIEKVDTERMAALRGELPVRVDRASLAPSLEHAKRPPDNVLAQNIVATHRPRDPLQPLAVAGVHDVHTSFAAAPSPRIVQASSPRTPTAASLQRPPFGKRTGAERAEPPLPPEFHGKHGASTAAENASAPAATQNASASESPRGMRERSARNAPSAPAPSARTTPPAPPSGAGEPRRAQEAGPPPSGAGEPRRAQEAGPPPPPRAVERNAQPNEKQMPSIPPSAAGRGQGSMAQARRHVPRGPQIAVGRGENRELLPGEPANRIFAGRGEERGGELR